MGVPPFLPTFSHFETARFPIQRISSLFEHLFRKSSKKFKGGKLVWSGYSTEKVRKMKITGVFG